MGTQVGYKPVYAAELSWARRWQGSRMERQPELRELVLNRLAQPVPAKAGRMVAGTNRRPAGA